jgi:24-methylenesterol C-methyltransferase
MREPHPVILVVVSTFDPKVPSLSGFRNHVIVSILSFLGLAPAGTTEVHEMLYKTAISLVEGGETGVFTPMHLLLCRKPEKQETPAAAASA